MLGPPRATQWNVLVPDRRDGRQPQSVQRGVERATCRSLDCRSEYATYYIHRATTMKAKFAEQYGRVCLVIDGTEDADEVIERAHADEATYNDGEDVCLVIRFPDRPQELYTEDALRRSLRAQSNGT